MLSCRSSATTAAASAALTWGPGDTSRRAVATARSQSTISALICPSLARTSAAAAAGEHGGRPVERRLGRTHPTHRDGVRRDVEGQQPAVGVHHHPGERADVFQGAGLGPDHPGGRLLAFNITADAVPVGRVSPAEAALDRTAAVLAGCGCR